MSFSIFQLQIISSFTKEIFLTKLEWNSQINLLTCVLRMSWPHVNGLHLNFLERLCQAVFNSLQHFGIRDTEVFSYCSHQVLFQSPLQKEFGHCEHVIGILVLDFEFLNYMGEVS